MNLNELAKEIAMHEGLKKSVNIAQIKEILKITLTELSQMKASEAMRLIEKYDI